MNQSYTFTPSINKNYRTMPSMKRLLQHQLPDENVIKYINDLAFINPTKAGEVALLLFCTPAAGWEFSARESLFLDGGIQKRYKVEDFEVQSYRWLGSGKKVLLLHGWDSNSARWRPLISLLKREGYDILAIDAPSHGKSGSRIAHGILNAKSLNIVASDYQPDIVIGHSFGGLSASYNYGKTDSGNLEKLILMAAPSQLETSFRMFYKSYGVNEVARIAIENVFKEIFGFETTLFNSSDFVRNISASGLIIHDQFDEVVPVSEAKGVHEAWPESELMITQNLGHSLQAPSVFHKILDFCAS